MNDSIKKRKYRRLFMRVLKYINMGFLFFVSGFVLLMLILFLTLPSLGELKRAKFRGGWSYYDAQGKIIARVVPGLQGRRRWIPINQVPSSLIKILLAMEDNRFWHHAGVDFSQLYYALLENVSHLSFRYGASTITQQLIKNVYLSNEKTIIRKVREIMLALLVESRLTKQQILEWYLNIIEMGRGVYGVAEGARYYFNKEPRDLSFAQQVFLVAIIQAPRHFDDNRKKVLIKINKMASRLHRFGLINYQQANLLRSVSYKFAPRVDNAPKQLRFFLQRATPILAKEYARYRVQLSLELSLQQRLEKVLPQSVISDKKPRFSKLLILKRNNRIVALLPLLAKLEGQLPNVMGKFIGYKVELAPLKWQVPAEVISSKQRKPIVFTQVDCGLSLRSKERLKNLPGS